ncbi:RNA-directed DNA polymerase [Clostridium tetani]|uniref:RNA-directed DNA polymerase n=1 Tax=Clostridium tetani TaxID=1513 RepID=UPI00100A7B19|nr:RNA-directed DNA polymerase [Clostridium tetani]RXM73601.1 hypothetical protein DP143_04375 [Clostridium tetani]
MKCYNIKKESYKAYSHIIEVFKKDFNIKLNYGTATIKEDKDLIAREIYSHFGAHYYKCINSLNDMKDKEEYRKLVKGVQVINIVDIGCNIGTATYAYIDLCLENRYLDEYIMINIIFIEVSSIRARWLKEMFDTYIKELNLKYKNVQINYYIINKSFPVEIHIIKKKLIDAPILVLISNFTHWNKEEVLAKSIDQLFNFDKEMYLLNIETNGQKEKVNKVVNYMKKYRIYDISGPIIKNNFKYRNLKCSAWKNDNEYKYLYNYYQTNIKEQDLFIYTNDKNRMTSSFNKALNTLKNAIISDEIEINYFIQNKMNILDLTRKLLKKDFYNIYNSNSMEFKMCKKNGTYRPLVVESGINEILSTSIITSIGIYIDMNQDENISFGNRVETKENVPNITKQFMEQYFKKFIYAQKNIKENNEYKYYCKLDLQSYYDTINHDKLAHFIDTFVNYNSWFDQGEWFKSVIKSYINRGNIDIINRNQGIPQGPPLSGVLANMYLKEYDEWFSSEFKENKMYRYVDDVIIFSNTEIKKDNVEKYTEYLVHNLNLKINKNKFEFGKLEELDFCELGDKYNQISTMTCKILSSIYNLPSSIYRLYRAEPRKIIYLIHESLKSIGIYISPSWLAIKLRKRKSIFIGIKINWGKMYGKETILKKQWKRDFIKKNSKFIGELTLLNSYIEEEFNNTYSLIQKGDNDILTQRRFKFIFNKLGTFTNVELINKDVFRYIKDKPWLVDLKRLRAYDILSDDVIKSINNNYTDYCNLVFIWLIGEYSDINIINYINNIFLDSLQKRDKESRLVNTLACITLMKLKATDKLIDIKYIEGMLEAMIKEGINDYIYIRNILFLINSIDSEYLSNNLSKEQFGSDNIELYELLNWIKKKPNQNIMELIVPMYNDYGIYLPEEELSPIDSSGY